MTDQVTAETAAKQPCRPAPAKHDTLAVLAFVFGITRRTAPVAGSGTLTLIPPRPSASGAAVPGAGR